MAKSEKRPWKWWGTYICRWMDWRSWCPDGVEVLMEFKCWWRQGIRKVEDDGQSVVVEIGKWSQIMFLKVTQYYVAELGFKPGLLSLSALPKLLCSIPSAEWEVHQLSWALVAFVVSFMLMRTHDFLLFIAPHRIVLWNFSSLSPLPPTSYRNSSWFRWAQLTSWRIYVCWWGETD